MTRRIYVVTPKNTALHRQEHRLVRATGRNAALRHVVEDTLQVTLATQDDIANLCGAGLKVEEASEQGLTSPNPPAPAVPRA